MIIRIIHAIKKIGRKLKFTILLTVYFKAVVCCMIKKYKFTLYGRDRDRIIL